MKGGMVAIRTICIVKMPKGIPNNGVNRGWFSKEPRPEKKTGVIKSCPCGKEFYCEIGRIQRKRYCSVKCRCDFHPKGATWEWSKPLKAYKRGKHLYKTREYRVWRDAILKRDKYKCKMCGTRETVQVHHIFRWADWPQHRYETWNGIALCKHHHPLKKADEQRYAIFFHRLTLI